MKKWIAMLSIMAVAGTVFAQDIIDSWDFNVPDGAINTQGSYSDLGAGGITWPDRTVAGIANSNAVFFGQGTNSTQNYFVSVGMSANQNELSGTYQISVDIVSADFANTAALDQQATWGIGIRGTSGDGSTDALTRFTYEGRLNVTNVTSGGVTNVLADADEFSLKVDSRDIGFGTVDVTFPGNSLSNLNIRQTFDLDADIYEVYYTADGAPEELLYSGALPDGFKLGELRIASQQFNGNAIWEAGDILAVDNIELRQLVAPTPFDPRTVIEQWDFTGDSLVGVNSNDFPDLVPSIWNDVPGDDMLTMSPDADQYRTENFTITPGSEDIYISWTLDNWDLSEFAVRSSAYFGLLGLGHIGVEVYNDTSTNVWAAIRSGNTQVVKARMFKGQTTNTEPYQVTARLDFADGEVQLFVSNESNWENWSGVQWADPATISNEYTAAFDFATVLTATNASFTQTRMAVTGLFTNEQVTVDQVYIKEALAANPISVSIVDDFGGTQNNTPGDVLIGSFTGQVNDVLVLLASGSNKNHIFADRVTFASADGGVVAATNLYSKSAVGIWYGTVTAPGSFDVIYTKTNNFTTVATYQVRSDDGSPLSVDTQGVFLAKSASSTSAALTYDFGASSDAAVMEALSTAAGGGASADDVLLQYDNGTPMKRGVGSKVFGATPILNTSWTIDQSGALGNVSLAGIAVYKDAWKLNTPWSLYADWLDDKGYTTNTNLHEDANGDGVDNLTDYASGGAENLPAVSVDGGFFVHMSVQWDEANAVDRGLGYEVQAADQLVMAAWSTNDVEFVGSADGVPGAGYRTVTNRIPADTGSEFMKLEISFTSTP